MGSATVTVLGALSLVLTVFNAVLGVMLVHLSFLKQKNKGLITWIYIHAGFESLNAVRDHYARGGMPISHEDTLALIEEATPVGDGDWSKEDSGLTDNDTTNERNLGLVLEARRLKAYQASAERQVRDDLRQLNTLESAINQCQTTADGRITCASGRER